MDQYFNDVELLVSYFLAKLIFMAVVGVILKPWSASLAAALCISDSNSTKAMSWRPGTRRTWSRVNINTEFNMVKLDHFFRG